MSEPPDTPTTASPPEGEPTSSQPASGLTIHGGVSSQRDTYVAVNQNHHHHYTLEQHQTRLKDYQLLLERLATSERARLLTVDEPPLTDGLPLDKLRLIMARAALNWPLPLPESDGLPLDDSMQRSWEWTSSRYTAYPDGAATVVDDRSTDDRDVPLRGGSWWSNGSNVRCGARYWGLPGSRRHPGVCGWWSPRSLALMFWFLDAESCLLPAAPLPCVVQRATPMLIRSSYRRTFHERRSTPASPC